MIYIISGASRSGKSISAKKISEKQGLPYIPTDSLMMGFMNGVPEMGINDKMWPNEIAEKMWPFLKSVIENMIYNDIDYLFEGEAFLPEKIKAITSEHPNKIKACFVGFAESNIIKKMDKVKKYSSRANDWLVNESDKYIEEHIENMIEYSKTIRSQCFLHGIKYFDTSEHFLSTIEDIVDHMTQDTPY